MFKASFLYGEGTKRRVKRHVVFWVVWWLYFGLLHAANPFGRPEISYFQNIPFTALESITGLFPHMLLTYSLLIIVLPHFVQPGKYVQAILLTLIFMCISTFFSILITTRINPWLIPRILPERFLRNTQRPPSMTLFMGFLSAAKGGITISGIAVGLKFMKQWFLKEQHNLKLQKENTEAQLKILTAQVHPHFLFNTLNNIYSLTQTTSPAGAKMVMGMSDLLRYMLYEGSKPRVPLRRELQMIEEYIRLEKIRYGNKLELHLSMPDNTRDLQIAPLLLLPFIENCFKHGASNILENPWVNLDIVVEENTMRLKLMNGKGPQIQHKTGIGIANVKQRLELLYPGKHRLEIINEEDVYVVNLEVELEVASDQLKSAQTQPTIAAYA